MTIKRTATSVLAGAFLLMGISGCSEQNNPNIPVRISPVLNNPYTAEIDSSLVALLNDPALFVVKETDKASLECYRNKIVGTWIGKNENPWTEPYYVEITFFADGKYSAHSLSQAAYNGYKEKMLISALYYGTDMDSDLKTWEINDVWANGEAAGELIIYFDVVGTTTTDSFRKIKFCNSFNLLQFDLWHFNMYGPVHYTLIRKP
jgi:hypothetical protein